MRKDFHPLWWIGMHFEYDLEQGHLFVIASDTNHGNLSCLM